MVWNSFKDFFHQATGGQQPYPYQTRLAVEPVLPRLVDVPTGAGKTAAATLAWLWRRRFADEKVRKSTPRRLAYCLPMRILVEQTRDVIRSYLDELNLTDVGLHILMGGDADDEWMIHPDADAILIGTQDMLLSRALNRGYGLSRFRWPQAFGLLHSDVLWIFDEVQLFGAGLPTTAQLDAFRRTLTAYGPVQSVWMSATLQPDWIATVDHPAPESDSVFRLSDDDFQNEALNQRMTAAKHVQQLNTKNSVKDRGYAREIAETIENHHRPGTLTLVIANTVDRATAIYQALRKADNQSDLVLLHSRFRPVERQQQVERLSADVPPQGRVVISTQVVEAGVDLSAAVLITELAPWSSIVQRLGRCNRRGEFPEAIVYWIDVEEKHALPYETEELQQSREILHRLEGKTAAPTHLPPVTLPPAIADVIRRRDLLDLFDTTPDLGGNDIDISRFIRAIDELDVQVFWRAITAAEQLKDQDKPDRQELCSAPVGQVRDFLKKSETGAWVYDHLEERWRTIRSGSVRPGLTILLPAAAGGYDPEVGWNPKAKGPVAEASRAAGVKPEGMGGDPRSYSAKWQSLKDHTDETVSELEALLERLEDHLPTDSPEAMALRQAARHHDCGKSHHIFQCTLTQNQKPPEADCIWAKSPRKNGRHSRPHFRHELASALAMLQTDPDPDQFLQAYLAAAHHGRVRMAIRSVDGESKPDKPGTRHALGIWDGDQLPEADLGGGVIILPTTLDLSPMEMGIGPDGQPSWTDRALALRDRLGPFRLAYLEALLRAADGRASAKQQEVKQPCPQSND